MNPVDLNIAVVDSTPRPSKSIQQMINPTVQNAHCCKRDNLRQTESQQVQALWQMDAASLELILLRQKLYFSF